MSFRREEQADRYSSGSGGQTQTDVTTSRPEATGNRIDWSSVELVVGVIAVGGAIISGTFHGYNIWSETAAIGGGLGIIDSFRRGYNDIKGHSNS